MYISQSAKGALGAGGVIHCLATTWSGAHITLLNHTAVGGNLLFAKCVG
jgi:hypothetical protein